MVFFTCDGCNETLKKNQVDAHAGRCRRCDSVTCVDCSIAFFGGKKEINVCPLIVANAGIHMTKNYSISILAVFFAVGVSNCFN